MSSVSSVPVSIIAVTHQRAACDAARVHFSPTIRRTDMSYLFVLYELKYAVVLSLL